MMCSSALQEPVERKLGRRMVTTTRNARPLQKAVCDFVYDIPLIESLQRLLSDSFILQEVHQYVAAIHYLSIVCNPYRYFVGEDGLMSDYCDGTVYKSHSLFSSVFSSLEILAYYDDVEVCNPLGSRAKKRV